MKKLEYSNLIDERLNKTNLKYELIDNTYLKDLNSYLPIFLKYLWENPKFIAKLLLNSDISDIKNCLAPFFMNNFYENILSSYYIEDNLMYVLTLLLKNEINNLKNCDSTDTFLNDNSPCKYLLSQIKKKNDVQGFFKSVIYDVVENLEIRYSGSKLNFEIEQKLKEIQSHTNKKKNKVQKTTNDDLNTLNFNRKFSFNNLDVSYMASNPNYSKKESDNEKFVSKYLPDMSKKDLEKQLESYKDDKNMVEYINKQIDQCKKNEEIFSNKELFDSIYRTNFPEYIFGLYQMEFMRVIEFIDKIFENLENNILLLPYSLKCLCKIISILLSKKFPEITTTQKNSFIANFFFKIIFSPIFNNPSIQALINDFIISENSLNNFSVISFIINQLVSGKLFTNKNYTPFNWYFLEKMPFIYNLFEQITNVTLTPFIEKLVNNELDENYKYNYFDENEEEVMFHRSICYNLDIIYTLLININKNKNKLFNNNTYILLEKTLEKLNGKKISELIDKLRDSNDYEIVKEIKNPKSKKIEYIEVKKRKKLYFFLNTQLIWNNNYKKLFSINQKSSNFKIKELDDIKNEENIFKNNIIKVKNYLSCLLCNYRLIKKNDFNISKTLNTIDILNEIKIFMNSSNFVIDGSIPSEWYSNALFEYIKVIPKDYIENDYKKLYSELESDINDSIKELDFEALSVCMDKMKFIHRGMSYYEQAITSIIDIQQNEKAKQIIENEVIPVEIKFLYSNTQKYFSITKTKINKLKILDDMVYEDSKIKGIVCPTIESFAGLFPNLCQYELLNINPFDIMKELKIPEKLLDYFKSTKIYLTKTQKNSNLNEIENISNKIYDYIMNKLHKKLFPSSPDEKDINIYNNCVALSWTEPKHFIKGKTNYVYDTFLPDVMKYIKQIESVKSPRKKLLNLSKIFDSILNLERFNGGNEQQGIDDIILILNYAIIKSRPTQLYNNARYMELFIGENINRLEGNQLIQLLAICEFIDTISYEKLFGVTKEEFDKKFRR